MYEGGRVNSPWCLCCRLSNIGKGCVTAPWDVCSCISYQMNRCWLSPYPDPWLWSVPAPILFLINSLRFYHFLILQGCHYLSVLKSRVIFVILMYHRFWPNHSKGPVRLWVSVCLPTLCWEPPNFPRRVWQKNRRETIIYSSNLTTWQVASKDESESGKSKEEMNEIDLYSMLHLRFQLRGLSYCSSSVLFFCKLDCLL